MIYIIHFDEKLAHAQHYVGYCKEERFAIRMFEHGAGIGAKILRALVEKGIHYRIANTFPGDRILERRIKNQKNTRRYCPICKSKHQTNE